VQNTGQIGPIKVIRIESRKKQTRIHFVCGWRALSDYDHKHAIVQSLTAHLTTADSEILASVERLENEAKRLHKELTSMQLQMLDVEIAEWVEQAEPIDPHGGINVEARVVRIAFDRRDGSLLKETARRLIEHPGTIALLATRQPNGPGSSPQFVFARSEDLSGDHPALNMGTLVRTACATVGGRGGGRPTFAQGGAPKGAPVVRVLDQAIKQLCNR
jgi:alanyl-tRNA synthetase